MTQTTKKEEYCNFHSFMGSEEESKNCADCNRKKQEQDTCGYCFEKVRNCVCHWNTCAECGKRIPDSHAMEYRGRVVCEEHDFEEQVAKRDFERQEVMAETDHAVRSQADGEWHNGGYKTMKTDPHTGRPVTKIKEPARLKQYESR